MTEGSASGSTRTKNMVLRLDPELAERLAAVAEVEGRSVSDVAREAIAALVEARPQPDPVPPQRSARGGVPTWPPDTSALLDLLVAAGVDEP